MMNALEDVEGLSECIDRAIQDHLAKSNINVPWPQLDNFVHPILRVEAFLEDAAPSAAPLNAGTHGSHKVVSVCLVSFFRHSVSSGGSFM